MALALNGSGTITGLAVGGVPDGTITTDNIANATLAANKFVNNPDQNNIVKIQHFTNNTRIALASNSSDNIIWSFTYNKVTSTNDVICMFNLPFMSNQGSNAVWTYMKMINDSTSTEERHNGAWPMCRASSGSSGGMMCVGIGHFTDSNGAGNYTMRIGYDNRGTTGGAPAATYCPQESSSDDTRVGNTMATCTVIEYTPA